MQYQRCIVLSDAECKRRLQIVRLRGDPSNLGFGPNAYIHPKSGHCLPARRATVQEWGKLSEYERATAFAKLHKASDGHIRLERVEIEKLAIQPELGKV
jgi:hypothetical protein